MPIQRIFRLSFPQKRKAVTAVEILCRRLTRAFLTVFKLQHVSVVQGQFFVCHSHGLGYSTMYQSTAVGVGETTSQSSGRHPLRNCGATAGQNQIIYGLRRLCRSPFLVPKSTGDVRLAVHLCIPKSVRIH